MPLPEALKGNTWTKVTAQKALPILVLYAEKGMPITYGELDKEIQKRGLGHHAHPACYGYPAGTIGDALLETAQKTSKKIPPINVLVINKKTRIPGIGCDPYLAAYVGKKSKTLSDKQRKTLAEAVIKDVYKFKGWQKILKSYGLEPLDEDIHASLNKKKMETLIKLRSGYSSEPESEEHKALKSYVAKNPSILESNIPFKVGKIEYAFPSADQVDVLFMHKQGAIAVEVKSEISDDNDIVRGLYQCIKYEALLKAELKAKSMNQNAKAALVITRQLTKEQENLSNLFGVQVIIVDQPKNDLAF